ncbi:MAG: DUF4194 domain-containing protein [Treponema sp.]|nr:DUF4194 domain-containing protein [Treponema sp.]
MSDSTVVPVWAPVCIKLLQGPVYRTGTGDTTWNTLTAWTSAIGDYFAQIGLTVFVDQGDGYAFLKQRDESDEVTDAAGPASNLPHLIKKYALTPEVSLLCVLLREALDQFDTSQNQSAMLVLKESEIKERLAVFIKEKNDQVRYFNKLDTYLNQLVNLSFLRELNAPSGQHGTSANQEDREFEVRRIIRAKINVEFLTEFKQKLQELNGTAPAEDAAADEESAGE